MNIYDIARESGVSISTVSRVMNGHTNVSAEKRNKVLSVLAKNNYVSSGIAKSLVLRSTNTVGILTVDIRHLHYANIAYTIEQEMSLRGYNVILCNTGEHDEEKAKYIKVLAEKQVDGMILVGSILSTPLIHDAIKRYFPSKPVVMFNSNFKLPNVYDICSNESAGIKLAIDHLVERGYSKIVLVIDYRTWVAEDKIERYKRGLAEHGLPWSKDSIIRVSSGFENGQNAAQVLLQRGIAFDSIIGCDDVTAIGMVKEFAAHGLRIPDDVGIIGFNNSVFSQVSSPPLTVVDNKSSTVGTSLARLLTDVLQGRDVPHSTSVYPELVIRGSV
ncbi:MAG: LacI family transcriptional regulator [Spirochaetae bacterium HGW-Spirochaetae-8]|nr:MAG: LacI family transcriptional regulator [Spirochaetae bacterium HGW-Spirochaetae-8]